MINQDPDICDTEDKWFELISKDINTKFTTQPIIIFCENEKLAKKMKSNLRRKIPDPQYTVIDELPEDKKIKSREIYVTIPAQSRSMTTNLVIQMAHLWMKMIQDYMLLKPTPVAIEAPYKL